MPTMTTYNLPSGVLAVVLPGDIKGIAVDPCHTCPNCDHEPVPVARMVQSLGAKPCFSLLIVCAESDTAVAPIPADQPNLSNSRVAVLFITPRHKDRVLQLLHDKHPVVALEELRAEAGEAASPPLRVMKRPRWMRA